VTIYPATSYSMVGISGLTNDSRNVIVDPSPGPPTGPLDDQTDTSYLRFYATQDTPGHYLTWSGVDQQYTTTITGGGIDPTYLGFRVRFKLTHNGSTSLAVRVTAKMDFAYSAAGYESLNMSWIVNVHDQSKTYDIILPWYAGISPLMGEQSGDYDIYYSNGTGWDSKEYYGQQIARYIDIGAMEMQIFPYYQSGITGTFTDANVKLYEAYWDSAAMPGTYFYGFEDRDSTLSSTPTITASDITQFSQRKLLTGKLVDDDTGRPAIAPVNFTTPCSLESWWYSTGTTLRISQCGYAQVNVMALSASAGSIPNGLSPWPVLKTYMYNPTGSPTLAGTLEALVVSGDPTLRFKNSAGSVVATCALGFLDEWYTCLFWWDATGIYVQIGDASDSGFGSLLMNYHETPDPLYPWVTHTISQAGFIDDGTTGIEFRIDNIGISNDVRDPAIPLPTSVPTISAITWFLIALSEEGINRNPINATPAAPGHNPTWWVWTPSQDQTVSLTTDGSGGNTTLWIYKGTLTAPVGVVAGVNAVSWNVIAGQTYFIGVSTPASSTTISLDQLNLPFDGVNRWATGGADTGTVTGPFERATGTVVDETVGTVDDETGLPSPPLYAEFIAAQGKINRFVKLMTIDGNVQTGSVDGGHSAAE
jgi:hypothetical protein